MNKKVSMFFNLFFAHIAPVWDLDFPFLYVVLGGHASYRAVQVKQSTLGGSLVLQMSFQGHLSIMGFLEHNCLYPSLTV